MNQLAIVPVDFFVDRLALLQALVSISAFACETVDGDLVNTGKIDFFVVDEDCIDQHPFPWFFTCVPSKANPREGGIPAR